MFDMCGRRFRSKTGTKEAKAQGPMLRLRRLPATSRVFTDKRFRSRMVNSLSLPPGPQLIRRGGCSHLCSERGEAPSGCHVAADQSVGN
jgi:hypothetical protein